MSDPTVSKTCFECHQTKPAAEFYRNKAHKDGLSARCRPCTVADQTRRYLAKHPEAAGRWPAGYKPPTEKTCLRCGVVKPLSEFHVYKNRRDKTQVWCKPCTTEAKLSGYRNDPAKHAAYNREWGRKNPDKKADFALKTRIGAPHGTYATMHAEQAGVCAICGTDKAGGNAKRLHVDHNATTGEIRGLLCGNCNNGLGRFAHSQELLIAAAVYLRRYE